MQERPEVQQPQQAPTQPLEESYPGKGIGIAGFVLAFVGVQLVGLILSIVGYSQSKKAGHKNPLAFAGIILNSVFLGLALLLIPLAIVTVVSYNGVTTRAEDSSAQSAAASVQKMAELYNANNGAYPTTTDEISDAQVTFLHTDLISAPSSADTVVLYTCGDSGNKISYWSYSTSMPMYTYTGTADENSDCTIAQ